MNDIKIGESFWFVDEIYEGYIEIMFVPKAKKITENEDGRFYQAYGLNFVDEKNVFKTLEEAVEFVKKNYEVK